MLKKCTSLLKTVATSSCHRNLQRRSILSQRKLEPSAAEFERLLTTVTKRLTEEMVSLPVRPAISEEGYEKVKGSIQDLSMDFPTQPRPLDQVMNEILDHHSDDGVNGASGGFTAFISGGGTPVAALADLISQTLNKFTGIAALSPGFVRLETQVVKMFCKLMGYPVESSFGSFTSGGSIANFTGIVTGVFNMRQKHKKKLHECVAYVSDQSHSCNAKAIKLSGLEPENIRTVSSDDHGRMNVVELHQMIEEDTKKGLTPILVVANAGTTYTGAVDDFEQLSALTKKYRMWLHADACYGGLFMLTSYGKQLLKGIETTDSMALDLHKSFFLPFGTGLALVKDAMSLRRTFTPNFAQSYLPDMEDEDMSSLEFYNFSEMSMELSRPFRGLRVWLPLQLYGIQAFQEYLDEKLEITRWLHRELSEMDGIEIVPEGLPTLTVVNFRLTKDSKNGIDHRNNKARCDFFTKQLLNQLRGTNELGQSITEAPKRFLYFPCVFKDKYCVRICILHIRTHQEDVQIMRDEIQSAVTRVWEQLRLQVRS